MNIQAHVPRTDWLRLPFSAFPLILSLCLCLASLVNTPSASAEDVITRAMKGNEAATIISTYYVDMHGAMTEARKRFEQSELNTYDHLGRSYGFYSHHYREMKRCFSFAREKHTYEDVSREDMIYVGRSYMRFMREHKKIMALVDRYDKSESAEEKEEIKKQIESYIHLRIFSALDSEERLQVEEPVQHPTYPLTAWIEYPIEITLTRVVKDGEDEVKFLEERALETEEQWKKRKQALIDDGYKMTSADTNPVNNMKRFKFVKEAPKLASIETKLEFEGKPEFVSDENRRVRVLLGTPDLSLIRDSTIVKWGTDDETIRGRIEDEYEKWSLEVAKKAVDRLKRSEVVLALRTKEEKPENRKDVDKTKERIEFGDSSLEGTFKVICSIHAQRKTELELGEE